MKKCHSSPKMDRKTAEKNRRTQMSSLYAKLKSVIPNQHSTEVTMLSEQLHEAANYIKTLQANLEKMKERKECLMEMDQINNSVDNNGTTTVLELPHVEIEVLGSALVVLLICGLNNQLVFYKTIPILEEEGAEVVNAGFFVLGDKIFHTIHSKISESEQGFKASRISGRLYELVHESL